MGGSSEPDGFRGFGRVHLEAGMPLKGEGAMTLYVADSNVTAIPELTRHEYLFDVNGTAGLELRVTLSWIDPPTSALSYIQQVHDLDLAVTSPNGTRYTMWRSGEADLVNVNERVIVDSGSVEADSGTWTVWVWAKRLTTDTQAYSLVVTGAISPATAPGWRSGTPAPTMTTGLATSDATGRGEVSTAPPSSGTGEPLTTTLAPDSSSNEKAQETSTSAAWSMARPDFVGSAIAAIVVAILGTAWAA